MALALVVLGPLRGPNRLSCRFVVPASSCDVVLSSFRDHEQENLFCEWHHILEMILDAYSELDQPYVTGEARHAAI